MTSLLPPCLICQRMTPSQTATHQMEENGIMYYYCEPHFSLIDYLRKQEQLQEKEDEEL